MSDESSVRLYRERLLYDLDRSSTLPCFVDVVAESHNPAYAYYAFRTSYALDCLARQSLASLGVDCSSQIGVGRKTRRTGIHHQLSIEFWCAVEHKICRYKYRFSRATYSLDPFKYRKSAKALGVTALSLFTKLGAS